MALVIENPGNTSVLTEANYFHSLKSLSLNRHKKNNTVIPICWNSRSIPIAMARVTATGESKLHPQKAPATGLLNVSSATRGNGRKGNGEENLKPGAGFSSSARGM